MELEIHDEWGSADYPRDLTPQGQRLQRLGRVDLDERAEVLAYLPDVSTNIFVWIVRSTAAPATPAPAQPVTGADRVVRELNARVGGVGVPITNDVLHAGWTTEHGSWHYQSVQTRRKRKERAYTRIVQTLADWPFRSSAPE